MDFNEYWDKENKLLELSYKESVRQREERSMLKIKEAIQYNTAPWKHILICGLPGTGKTTLASALAYHFKVPHYNADTIREYYSDWDFSFEGRVTQANRMRNMPFGILDFVCPTNDLREIVQASYMIWMNTKESSKYEDTNKLWEDPTTSNIEVLQWIDIKQLHSSLVGFNPGMMGIQSYLKEHLPKLVRS